MQSPFLTIIIPFYNGEDYVIQCLDSIRQQNIEQYEIICVDDCSTDNTKDTILSYKEKYSLDNLIYIRHTENQHCGGSRNTGIRIANGDYISFLDQDDVFLVGALPIATHIIAEHPNIDILMFDYRVDNRSMGTLQKGFFRQNSTRKMTGKEFLLTQQVPWEPWQYIYRRDFLLEQQLFFTPHVLFEDTDFVLKATALASSMAYNPHDVVCHIVHPEQTSSVNKNFARTEALFMQSKRVKQVALEFQESDNEIFQAIMAHHWYKQYIYTIRYIWNLPFKQMKQLLSQYPSFPPSKEWKCRNRFRNSLLQISIHHPAFLAYCIFLLKPVIPLARKIFRNKYV